MGGREVLSADALASVGGPWAGQVGTICHHSRPLCGRVSVATASAGAIVPGDSIAHIFIARLLLAPQQKQIDTYKPQPHLAHMTHFRRDKKRTFWPVENLEKSLVAMETGRPARHGPLNSNQM